MLRGRLGLPPGRSFMVQNKPTVPEVLPLVRAYYAKPGNAVGGNLHIVLDEGNVETGHVEWCLARAREEGDADGAALAELLLRMSKTQRSKLASLAG
jgi:hypothetical protein